MTYYYKHGFLGGFIGAIILGSIMYVMEIANMGQPAFISMYRGAFGAKPPTDQVIAFVLFALSGGVWGIVYAIMVKQSTVLKGMLFGLLPTLWLWVIINSFLGKPLFNGFTTMGIIMPLIFNVVIWGIFMGWYLKSRSPRPIVLSTVK